MSDDWTSTPARPARRSEVEQVAPARTAPMAGKVVRIATENPAAAGQHEENASRHGAGDGQRAGDWGMDPELMQAMGLTASPGAAQAGAVASPQSFTDPDSAVCRPTDAAAPASGARDRVSTGREGSVRMGSVADLAPPVAGINLPGFVDHSDGSFLRAGPAEAGAPLLHPQPLPPATRVFVSGVHPQTAQWWYVTAFLPDALVRGYVQSLRVTTDLPEPTATLHQIQSGDTAERLAVQEFKSSVRDGHDLRYYENVLLKVNQDKGRAGIVGSYQAPGVLGGGSNHIQLIAGHRIWLVSPAYAKAVEGAVPDGSLSNGRYAKVKRFAGHLQDLLASVIESPAFFDEVTGELGHAIREHLPELLGITAAFLTAEAVSIAAAASPTGVGQLLAFLIQTLLAMLGAHAMVEASAQALAHGAQWMQLAWAAAGDAAKLAAASREFLRMLLAIALAALAYTGAKGNAGTAASMLVGNTATALPALAVAGSRAGTAIDAALIGPRPGLGPAGISAGMMMAGSAGEKTSASKVTEVRTLGHVEAIKQQLQTSKRARIQVASREEAEDVLRAFLSSPGERKVPYRNTTSQKLPSGSKAESGSDWLPEGRGAYQRPQTYHWDAANSEAAAGDHALEGNHLQIHNSKGEVIRVFYP